MVGNKKLGSWRGVLVALTLGLWFMAQAQATYVVGRWDPPFGLPFAEMGWRGEVTVDIPDDCSEFPSGIRLVGAPGCSLPWTVIDATVEFYALADPFEITVETLSFTSLLAVESIHIDGAAEIDGFSTIAPSPSTSSVLSTGPLSSNGYYFGLHMVYTGSETEAQLYWTSDPLALFSGLNGFEGVNNPDEDIELRAIADVGEVLLPEPGSLALVGVGLSVLVAGAWRRRQPAIKR